MGGVDVVGASWSGARLIFGPIILLAVVFVALKAIAWIVKAKRGY